MTALRLTNLSKNFAGATAAVADLSLDVASGELLVLLGPSGSGKTTLLRLIAGLETPTAGRVEMDGQDVTAWPAWKRQVALVFQRPVLYPQQTVRGNLLAGLRLAQPWWRRLPPVPLEETARALGLSELLDRRPEELSGGQQQRVALGRALLRQPRILLLDEPLGGLESSLRFELRRELHLLQRQRRVTMIYVTHDPQEALALGDRLAVIEQGRLVQVGTASTLCTQPATLFVMGLAQSFPGTIVHGICKIEEGQNRFQTGSLNLPLPRAGPVLNSPLLLGLPVEAIQLSATATGEGFLGEVKLVAATPTAGWLVSLHAAEVLWTALVEQPPPVGQQVHVRIDWHRARWFAPSGQALETVA